MKPMLIPGKLYILDKRYNGVRFQTVREDSKKEYYLPDKENSVSVDNKILMFVGIRKIYYNILYTPLTTIFLLRNDFVSTDSISNDWFDLV